MGRITRKEENLLGQPGDGNLMALTLHALVCCLLLRFLKKDLDLAKYSLWVLRVYAALSTPVSYIQLRFTHCSTMAGNAEFAFLISARVFCCPTPESPGRYFVLFLMFSYFREVQF